MADDRAGEYEPDQAYAPRPWQAAGDPSTSLRHWNRSQVYSSHEMTSDEPNSGHDSRAVFAANPPLKKGNSPL